MQRKLFMSILSISFISYAGYIYGQEEMPPQVVTDAGVGAVQVLQESAPPVLEKFVDAGEALQKVMNKRNLRKNWF